MWLTDFAEAGLKPLLWNYTSLEAIIRFDWIETQNVRALHELGRSLTESLVRINVGGIEPQLRKPARAVRRLRQLALRGEQVDQREYQLGLFYHAARRLAAFNPVANLTDEELSRLTNVVLTQAMICAELTSSPADSAETPEEK